MIYKTIAERILFIGQSTDDKGGIAKVINDYASHMEQFNFIVSTKVFQILFFN